MPYIEGVTKQDATEKMYRRHGLAAFYRTPDFFQVAGWLRRQADACERRNATLFAAQVADYRADYNALMGAE